MLKFNPNDRITIEDAINHTFFDEIRIPFVNLTEEAIYLECDLKEMTESEVRQQFFSEMMCNGTYVL